MFFGTNQLTRCPVSVPYFLLFLVSEKLFWKYSRNWTPQRPKSLFSPEASRSPKESRRRAPGRPHHAQAWAHPWPRLGVVRSPRSPLTSLFRLFILPRGKTLKQSAKFHETFRSRRHRQPKFRGTDLCSGTLPGRGSAPGSHLQ